MKAWEKWRTISRLGGLLGSIMVIYSIVMGLVMKVPLLPVLSESIRILFFHTPMWGAMIGAIIINLISGIFVLRERGQNIIVWDVMLRSSLIVLILFGIAGILTGMIWARVTWGAYWTTDPKLNSVAFSFLLYTILAFIRTQGDTIQNIKTCGWLSVIAFVFFVLSVLVIPRFMDSLHPGSGGNPPFVTYDMDYSLRVVFYPAMLGWFLVSIYLCFLVARITIVREKRTSL